MNFRDVELLSAYLDGRLSPSDAARLEARLSSDTNLKSTLEDLRETRGLLRRLPQRRAPRNFRLTPKMAGIKPPEPRTYPIFRLATALAAFLFIASVALNAVTPFAAPRLAAAPAPAYGKGGGGGGGPEPITGSGGDGSPNAPAATEVQPLAAVMPTMTAEATISAEAAPAATSQAQDTGPAQGDVEATEQAKRAAPQNSTGLAERSAQPVPVPWIVALGVVMLVLAVAAWLMRRNNERRIREQWKQK